MSYFYSYRVNGCEDKDTSHLFMRAILAYSDAFSLIYFKYRHEEELTEGVSKIKEKLAPFELDSRYVTVWPGTKIINRRGNAYKMITYRIDYDVIPILEEVNTLWDWDYPQFPMDPCFYRKGRAWFAVSTHEHWNALYLKEDGNYPLVSDLESLGVSLEYVNQVAEVELFYNQHYLWD